MNPSGTSKFLNRREFVTAAAQACVLLEVAPGLAATTNSGLTQCTSAPPDGLRVMSGSGQYEIAEGERSVLRYNYAPIGPGELLPRIAEPNRKYAVARSDYIHPLFGLDGEVLTRDWPIDHPHHRGIYWAWPEVDWRGQRGDLHALQKVFARPTGKCHCRGDPAFAEIVAENVWVWENGVELVRELATIRACRRSQAGRFIELQFRFEALKDPIRIARRDTTHYGGLNLRLSGIRDQRFLKVSDAKESRPRRAWSDVSGTFEGGTRTSGLAVIQHRSNPCYPGDWIEYPELNWLQPAFPASGTRYELLPGVPLELGFTLMIHEGRFTAALGNSQWDAAQGLFSG